eukprot:gnl/TRDRNA2_/TRDRNA2_178673_c0_seq1.p1 gnl/TRDRNA2_/TRDRNA2_178673_c0~~gnl/TRDRNA2_/TRDRNA2_178673_c0_seq1.p1  ORF type:complete len:570 (+),score=154.11 gnl/TRDRNA2_/TRDRNA2_178673_c0_seq1:79-1710(+)
MSPASNGPVRLDEIKLTDVDFEAVAQATDKHVIKRYIKLLEEDGGYFHELLQACKDKFAEIAPKEHALMYPRATTAQEIDEATRDLLNWQDSVAKTDAALLSARKNVIWEEEKQSRYPIRGQEAVIARPNIKKPEIQEAERRYEQENDVLIRDKSRMKDYYAAWDAMDVDAMEQEMDEEEKRVEEAKKKHFDDMKDDQKKARDMTDLRSGGVVEDVPEAHKKHMADSEKEKGNEAFYCKDYEEAEVYYSRSIQYGPGDPSTWSNRALCRLKLGNPNGCLEDCEHALALNPKYMKALHRKGKALYELSRYEDAVRCFQLALAESPGNTQINGDLMVARRKLRTDGPGPRQTPPRVNDPPTCVIEEIKEETKPVAGYTRVAIEEDSDSDEEIACDAVPAPAAGSAASASSAAPKFHKVIIEEGSDSEADEASSGPPPAAPSSDRASPSSKAGFRKVQVVEESDSEEEEPQATTPKASGTPSGSFHKVQIVEESESEPSQGSPASGSPTAEDAASKDFRPPPRVAESSKVTAEEVKDDGICLDGMD